MVKELNQYWQSQKQETLSLFHTETLLESGIITIQDTNGIITGTGTTGCTIDLHTQSTTGNGIIFIGVIIAGGIAHLLDRKLNQNLESELMDLEDRNQNQD